MSKVIDLFEKGIILLLKNSSEMQCLKISIHFYHTHRLTNFLYLHKDIMVVICEKKWVKVSWIFQNSSIRHITNTFSMTCRPHWCQKLLTCSKRESFYFWKIILQKCNALKIKVRLNSVGFAFWMNKIRWPKPKHEWNKSA